MATGLIVRDEVYAIDGKATRFLDITCRDSRHESVFDDLCVSICSRVASGENPNEAAEKTIEDFRALLTNVGVGSRTVSQVCGLIGELLVLQSLLFRSADAWQAWVGPRGDRHDFRLGVRSVEVKTTTRPANWTVTIHGLEQMEAPSDGDLHLVHICLEPVSRGPVTVANLARAIEDQASNAVEFRSRLTDAGCEDPFASEWNEYSFVRKQETWFSVTEGFPKLTAKSMADQMLQAAICRLEYDIDLSLASHFQLSNDSVTTLLEDFVRV